MEYAPSKRGAPADKLFIPTDQLDLIRNTSARSPKLNKLGLRLAATKANARHAHDRQDLEAVLARQRTKGSRSAPTAMAEGAGDVRIETTDQLTPSMMSSPTWRNQCRWIASSAATSFQTEMCESGSRPYRTASGGRPRASNSVQQHHRRSPNGTRASWSPSRPER
ncbi:MAG: hypothetical protein ACLTUB_01880 [Bifidobacterium longum]